MKKILSLVLVMLMVISIVPIASAYESEYYTYYLTEYTNLGPYARISKVDPDISGDITIPATIHGYPVDGISSSAFENCTKITSIKFETPQYEYWQIRSGAFKGCTSLKSVTLPDEATILYESTFEGCTSLEYIDLAKVETIQKNVFKNCTALKSIDIPKYVSTLDSDAFYGCSDLEIDFKPFGYLTINKYSIRNVERYSLILSDPVAANAFTNCENLVSVNFHDLLYTDCSIGEAAFKGCVNLENVRLSKSVKTVADSAFQGCTALKKVTVDAGVESIGNYAFEGCTVLEDVTLGEGLKTIGDNAFDNCPALKSVDLPDSLETLGVWVFQNSGIKEINIPVSLLATISHHGYGLFIGIEKVHFEGTKEQWEAAFEDETYKPTYWHPDLIVCIYNGPRENHKHAFTEYVEAKGDYYCTEGWEKRYYCVCGDYEKEDVAPTGHQFSTYVYVEGSASCSLDGNSISYCDNCQFPGYKTAPGTKLPHTDNNHDGYCDNCNYNSIKDCTHKCHKGGFFYKISLFFWKIFKINRECACGIYHY